MAKNRSNISNITSSMNLFKYFKLTLISVIGILSYSIIFGPVKPFIKTLFNNQSPQLVLVLGGDIDREKLGLKMANELRLPIIISGGSNPEYSEWLVQKEGIKSDQVKRDYRAKDTLGNFTSLVDELSNDGINHALLITSEDHIDRAMTIGNIVAGSRGIRLTSISVPCASLCKDESQGKQYIDLIRAITWVGIGKDPKNLIPENMSVDFID